MQARQVITPEQAQEVAKWLVGLVTPFTVTVKEGKVRTNSQNALAHRWFGDIAEHFGDRDYIEVKAECAVNYGVPIRRREPLFNFIWEKALAALPYEKQCAFFEKQYRLVEGEKDQPVLYMTSVMTAKEMTEYMNAMGRHYRAEGVKLTNPEDLRKK